VGGHVIQGQEARSDVFRPGLLHLNLKEVPSVAHL
jgi:hypothetical protein